MPDLPRPTEIDQTIALDWLHYSLGQGEVISPAALKLIQEHEGHAYVLVPKTVDPSQLSDLRYGMSGTGPGAAQKALVPVLETLAGRGAACVVVEDEIRLKRHPKPSVDGLLRTVFVGELVLHWAGLAKGMEDAILVLHRGSGGYPTNAFVTSVSEQQLGLVDGADLDDDIAGPVVGALMAVIVAAYDDETFLIWEPS
jgi:hypothetical protein